MEHGMHKRKKKRGSKGQHKIGKVMHEFKHGTLRSGSGHRVTSRKQAIAIAMSEARKVSHEGSMGHMFGRKKKRRKKAA